MTTMQFFFAIFLSITTGLATFLLSNDLVGSIFVGLSAYLLCAFVEMVADGIKKAIKEVKN